ncbi:hypothetical protein GN156_26835, partial [bacterium LRH843]|nr:hypothetical protein [bacterium LRH843]
RLLQDKLADKSYSYEFFHYEKDRFGEIIDSTEMPVADKMLMAYPKKYGKKVFPSNSAFLKGCIRITKNKET